MGGFAAAAALEGASPALYSLDVSVPERPKARTAREDAARLIRGRLADPRWIAAQLRHGYRGAQELAQGLDAVFVLAAASDAVTDAGFEALYAAWVADAEVFEHLRAANPAAARAILERFDEARDRGLWHSRRNALPGLNTRDDATFYFVCLVAAAVWYGLTARLLVSRFGLVLRGIRQSERRMAALCELASVCMTWRSALENVPL